MSLKKTIKKTLPPKLLLKIHEILDNRPILRKFASEWESALTTYTQPDVFKKLVQGVGYCISCGVKGHIAEFGTMSGKTATILAQSLSYFSKKYAFLEKAHGTSTRQLLLFDSFKGLPKATNNIDETSLHVASGIWNEGTCKGLTKEQLTTKCKKYLPMNRIKVFDGWFSETLPLLLPDDKFAMVHIDCDLYESTIQVLDFCFQKNLLSDGCALFFDDWNCNRASPKFGERRAWDECLEKYAFQYSDCGEYGICGHKFIFHQK